MLAAVLIASSGFAAATPATAFAAAETIYKSEPQWYNGPVSQPVLGGNTMAFTTLWEGNGWNLYTTDLAMGKDLKIGAVSQSAEFAVSGTRVAWNDRTGNKSQVKVFDRTNFSTSYIADSYNEIGRPSIDGTNVVWREGNQDQYGSQIRVYDLTYNSIRTLSSYKFYSNPVIAGNLVAWFETDTYCAASSYRLCTPANAQWNLVVYDLASSTSKIVAYNVDTKYAPSLSVSRVVWSARVNGQYDLFQYNHNFGVIERLTNDELEEVNPVTANGRVAYVSMPYSGAPRIVRVITLADRSTIAMQYAGANQEGPAISGNRVAWSETRDDSRIYVYDFSADANLTDMDSDGLSAQSEAVQSSNDMLKDTDGDTIPDTDEVVLFHTNPAATDTDGDGLSDYQELYLYKSNPRLFDTDRDGFNDGVEVKSGYSPTNAKRAKLSKKFRYEWSAPKVK